MAYERPQTLRTARAAADLSPSPRRAKVEGRTQRSDISAFSSVPDWSSSIISKHFRAAFKNSLLNSASAFSAERELLEALREAARDRLVPARSDR